MSHRHLSLVVDNEYRVPGPVAVPFDDNFDPPDPDVDVAAEALANVEAARLLRALRTLPPLDSLVMCMIHSVGGFPPMSAREIARRCNISTARVARIEQRSTARLREIYGVADAA